jgi:hypothetical protein
MRMYGKIITKIRSLLRLGLNDLMAKQVVVGFVLSMKNHLI